MPTTSVANEPNSLPKVDKSRLLRLLTSPVTTLLSVIIAIGLGIQGHSFLQYLRPIGDLYIALLQICVLPFLLAAIPLAVRSALASGTAGHVVKFVAFWSLIVTVAVGFLAIAIPSMLFVAMPPEAAAIAKIGAFVGTSSDRIDVEFILDQNRGTGVSSSPSTGLLALVPTNIFASLASNDSLRVLLFSVLFGLAMVQTERQSGQSVFGALRSIQSVCNRIFDWFNVLAPVGIIALIAPQIATLGTEVLGLLALFLYAYLLTAGAVIFLSIVVVSIALRVNPAFAAIELMKPIMLCAATRNALVCIPQGLQTMKVDLKALPAPCDLFIPVGFAAYRVGTFLFFVVACLFVGLIMGRVFTTQELMLVALLSFGASFATIGLSGFAQLVPLASVLRPFGLSYEVALPLLIAVDPIASIVRGMVNIAGNLAIPALAGGRVNIDA